MRKPYDYDLLEGLVQDEGLAFAWLTGRLPNKVVRCDHAALKQHTGRTVWEYLVEYSWPNNDEALTITGGRFVSSTKTQSTEVGLGKAIVAHHSSIKPNNWVHLICSPEALQRQPSD